jgi:pimeloyl-ACP methyl ester carboxylesterase
MRSSNDIWNRMAWNPRAALCDHYRIIGMDQRNAGASTAPISGDDDWTTFADDQLALARPPADRSVPCDRHVYRRPVRRWVFFAPRPNGSRSAVLLQPVWHRRQHRHSSRDVRRLGNRTRAAAPRGHRGRLAAFGDHMFNGEFLLSVTREDVAACRTPLLVLMGDDQFHPQSTSREIVALAPDATLVEHWKDDEFLAATDATIKDFLAEHTPA